MGDIDVGVKAGPTGVSGHMKGNVKDCVLFGALTVAGLAAVYGLCMGVKYIYEKACKEAGLNTKDNPHNNELGPRYANKSKSGSTKPLLESKPQPANDSDGEAEAEEGKQLEENAEQAASQVDTAVGGDRSSKPTYSDLGDIASNPENRVTQLMGEWLKQGEVTLLCAKRGAGKSQLATQIAIDLAKGGYSQLLEVPVEIEQRCVYLAYEMTYAQWGERYKDAVSLIQGLVQLGFPVPERENIKGALQDCRELCEEELKQGTRHLMIFIDNLAKLVKDPNNPQAKEAKELVMGLRSLQSEFGSLGMAVTVMILVHTDKAGSAVKGSGTWEDCTDATIFISGEGLGTPRRVELSRTRSSGAPEPFIARIENEPYLHFRRMTTEELQMEQTMAEVEKLRKLGYEFEEEMQELPDAGTVEKNFALNALLAVTTQRTSESPVETSHRSEQSAQPDSASDEPQEPRLHEWTALQWRDLDKAEQRALYHIIIRESESGINNKEIARKIQDCFGVTVQESKIGDFVNAHKKGKVPNVPKVTTKRERDDIKHILMDYYPDGESYWDSLPD